MAAFPEPIAAEVRPVFAVLPPARLAPTAPFEVATALGPVSIPGRIYHEPPPANAYLSDVQRLAVSCLYTRHHDGRVRERCLRSITGSAEPWVVPFVVALVGEYVVEILDVISRDLVEQPIGATHRAVYGDFIARNPAYWAQTESRMVSYWSCYHRRRWPTLDGYPGYAVVRRLRATAVELEASLLPSRVPAESSRLVAGD